MLNLKNTLDGYLKNVEVIGNTVQDTNNLANIRSVGDKVEGQELYKIPVVSCGKNLFIIDNISPNIVSKSNNTYEIHTRVPVDLYNKGIFKAVKNVQYTVSYKAKLGTATNFRADFVYTDGSYQQFSYCNSTTEFIQITATSDNNKQLDYVRFNWTNAGTVYIKDIQIEEGTQATPYEPYQENKLEILSPVQLEKAGDIRDRIIEKNGVWGVEKTIVAEILDNSFGYYMYTLMNNIDALIIEKKEYHSKNYYNEIRKDVILQGYKSGITYQQVLDDTSLIGYIYQNQNNTGVIFPKNITLEYAKSQVLGKKIYLQYAEPQFIPLPHDQQVKLRTFAGQTNIAFLTEIPGQIKAQVPKSLGATVNTHTEQIAELYNSLDRVKKLEETTVPIVETESGFTTVDATSNGYFEDVKLEGKTLVNVLRLTGNWFEQETTLQTDSTTAVGLSNCSKRQDLSLLKDNTVYTVVPFVDYTVVKKGMLYLQLNSEINGVQNAIFKIQEDMFNKPTLITTKELTNKNNRSLFIGGANCEYTFKNVKILMLEGDHTNNPPEYFEGVKSVGQDVEEVSVLSVNNGNLAYNTIVEIGDITTKGENGTRTDRERTKGYIEVLPNSNIYTSPYPVNVYEYDKDYNFIRYAINVDNFKTSSNTKYIRCYQGVGYLSEIILAYSSNFKNQINKQDKKEILYFNPTTETWEKPILREWDTIEKHSDGKYYYHKRSNEIILNGGEGWSSYIDLGNTARCYFTLNTPAGGSIGFNAICNKFIQSTDVNKDAESMWITTNNNRLGINILKSKLSTQDVTGFKAWLQANPTTVVYQLAQEEVYECTDIDLMTYSGETNYIINSGAISPKSLLKVHNNISNVVKILQEKVSLLENTFIAGLKSVLSGDMYSLATILYPEDFEQNDNIEQGIMVIPE